MKHDTVEQFLILIQHPEKSKFLVSDQIKNFGLIGSILLDLSFEGAINIENGKLILKSTETRLSIVHKTVLEQIEKSMKSRKIKTWIVKLSGQSGKYQKDILLELEGKGYFKIEPKRFLFFNYYKVKLIDIAVRDQIISEIRDVILGAKKLDENKATILGLIEACKMYKVICYDKTELKVCKRKLRELIQSDLISQSVDKVIKEMQAAIIGAVAASTVAVTVPPN